MKISVIICTHNRAVSLRRTLASFGNQIIPHGTSWELLVIDNASTDNTSEVVSEFEKVLPIRCVREGALGKSAALNRALKEAYGSLLLFTDDDVTLEPGWIASYATAAERHPQASFFGGPVLAAYEGPTPPRWVTTYDNILIVLALDRGKTDFEVAPPCKPFFVGANMAAKRSLFEAHDNYDERIGPKGSPVEAENKVDGEEILLQRRWLDKGAQGLYVAGAIVNHYHPPDRLTEKRLRLMHAGKGIREVRLGLVKQQKLLFGAPLYFWRLCVFHWLRYALLRPWPRITRWVLDEAMASYAWGVIRESRSIHRSSPAR